MRVALLVQPLGTLHRRFERAPRDAAADFSPGEAAWAVGVVARRLPGTHCLARSLALHALLRSAGFDSELRIGVAPAGEAIAAHAWVTCDGEALDGGAAAYVDFGSLPR